MEKLRPYFTLRDGSDRRGNSVVPHWIRFCSGFDSVAVCRQREGLPSIRANTTRAKPYAIARGRSIALGRILIQAGAAKGFQIVFTLSILFDRHLVCDPGE